MRISDWSSDVCSSDLDAFLHQHGERGAGGHDALAADAGFGEALVQGEVAALGEVAVDGDQFLHAADLATEHDALGRQAQVDRARGRVQRGARSEEHTSELQSLMRISYAVFCLQKK